MLNAIGEYIYLNPAYDKDDKKSDEKEFIFKNDGVSVMQMVAASDELEIFDS